MRSRILAALVVLVASTGARAQTGSIAVGATPGDCPSASQLLTALERFLPGQPAHLATTTTAADEPLSLLVSDEGDGYRVTVAGRERRFHDPSRRCDERARTAGVFAALTVRPPRWGAGEGGDRPSPSRQPATTPALAAAPDAVMAKPTTQSAATVPRDRFVELEGLAVAAWAPAALPEGGLLAAGGGLRVAAGWRFVGGTLGITALSPLTLEVEQHRARVTRVPMDVGARLLLRLARADLYADLGLSFEALVATGLDLAPNRGGTSWPLGARVAAGVHVRATTRLSVVASAEARATQPVTLSIDGRDVLETPTWWIGALLGVSWRAL